MSTNRPRRAREQGIPLPGKPGAHNAITDVPGVEVGFQTLIEDRPTAGGTAGVRTGVTAILPRGRRGAGIPVAAGSHVLNGNGEMTGTIWVNESGGFNTPILITNTHSVGACHEGSLRWMIENHPEAARQWLFPVVAETWDGYLNDINGLHVRPEHAVRAIASARSGPVTEGAVGGGTGMVCYGYKGGSGTASRLIGIGDRTYTLGVFVQANHGDRSELTVAGVPLGEHLLEDNPSEDAEGWFATPGAGSIIVIVATDAPLLPGQCTALARRVPLGLARNGTSGSHFSGDVFLAFSTANRGALRSAMDEDASRPRDDEFRALPWGLVDPLYRAVVEATEEAVLNVLFAGEEMVGHAGRRIPAMPPANTIEQLDRVLRTTQTASR